MEDDRTPEADIIFYKSGPEQGYTLLEAGMFGFYAPEDGHMPCIAVTEAQPATKIVFKIPVKGWNTVDSDWQALNKAYTIAC